MTDGWIYHLCSRAAWREAVAAGVYRGGPMDRRDGFIHFSDHDTLADSLDRHFDGTEDLLLLVVDPAVLGDALMWEPSRGGRRFPHLYAALDPQQVTVVHALRRGADGRPRLPADLAEA
jgi:uncharacterized protein (DUF952 family)